LFNYAARRRHLPPYAENPFAALDRERIPVENARPLCLFTAEQVTAFLQVCDGWQFPVFLALMLTGLRPGELTHLLLPGDLDLEAGVLRVRNKPRLGWQVKTRNERDVPLVPVLAEVLRRVVGDRASGPVFRRRRFTGSVEPPLAGRSPPWLEGELARRAGAMEGEKCRRLARAEWLGVARGLWRDLGALKADRVRVEFMAVTRAIGLLNGDN
jgi:integrase